LINATEPATMEASTGYLPKKISGILSTALRVVSARLRL